jgi:hypothetical protein
MVKLSKCQGLETSNISEVLEQSSDEEMCNYDSGEGR